MIYGEHLKQAAGKCLVKNIQIFNPVLNISCCRAIDLL